VGTLLVQTPTGGSHFHRLTDRPVVLGRSREADIQVPARGVSRRHCSVTMTGKQYILEDLDSKNGVYLNEERVRRTALRHNDCVILGEARIYYYDATVGDDGSSAKDKIASAPSKPASGGSEGPLRWVESPSEVLMNAREDAYENAGLPTPDPTPGKMPNVRKLERQIEALRDRRRLLDIRCLALERMAFVTSTNQLFERAGEVLFEEIGAGNIAVFRDVAESVDPGLVYLRLGPKPLSAPAAAASSTSEAVVPWSRASMQAVRQAMKPMAFRISADDSGAEQTASAYILAPLMAAGRWYGVMQVAVAGLGESDELARLSACGEVASAVSMGLAHLTEDAQSEPDETHSFVGRRTWPQSSTPAALLYWRIGLTEDGWPKDALADRLREMDYFMGEVARIAQGLGGVVHEPAGAGVVAWFEGARADESVSTCADAAMQAMMLIGARRRAGQAKLACAAIVAFGELVQRPSSHRGRTGHEHLPSLIGPPLDELLSLTPFLRDGDILATPRAVAALGHQPGGGPWVDWSSPTMDDLNTLFTGWKRLRWKNITATPSPGA